MKTTKMNLEERLSEHFTLKEMTRSATALRLNIDNTPPAAVVDNLRRLCVHVLEPLRRRFGMIRISSGYRCEELNRKVGGVSNSQHTKGEAADIHTASMAEARKYYDWLQQNTTFDQLLLERRMGNGCCWLHVSYKNPARGSNRQMARFMKV